MRNILFRRLLLNKVKTLETEISNLKLMGVIAVIMLPVAVRILNKK